MIVDFLNFAMNFSLLKSGVPNVFNVGLKAFAKNTMEPTIITMVMTIQEEVQVHALNPINITPERTKT